MLISTFALSGLSGFRKTHPRRTSGSRHDITSAMSSKSRVQALIRELEKEFEALYTENSLLRERVARLEKGKRLLSRALPKVLV